MALVGFVSMTGDWPGCGVVVGALGGWASERQLSGGARQLVDQQLGHLEFNVRFNNISNRIYEVEQFPKRISLNIHPFPKHFPKHF
jgi:hypothetical protein